MDKEELYHILLERDAKAQATVAIEELAELQKELTKYSKKGVLKIVFPTKCLVFFCFLLS